MIATIPLGEVAHVFNGKTPSKAEKRSVGHPVLKIKDVDDRGVFCGEFDSFVDESFAQRYRHKAVQTNDVLILNAAHNSDYVGSKMLQAPHEVQGSIATGEWLMARSASDRLDQSYMWHWFQSPPTRDQIRGKVKGIHLYPRDVAELLIPVPPPDEQRRIAAILDKADGIRRKREQAIALADDFLRSVFLEMFGDLNNRKHSFPVTTVEAVCEIITDCLHTTPSHFDDPNQFPSVRSSELQGGYIDLSSAKYVSESEYKIRIQRYRPVPGDTIYCREGARFGSCGIVPEGMTPCLGQRTMLLRADCGVATPEYLWAVLRSESIFQQALNVVGGAASPHVNIKDIRKFKCSGGSL
jgi:type I restriction enzyme S subunit